MIYSFFKRFIDIVLSLAGVVLFSPLFIVIAVLIKIDSKGPILFKQKRFGQHKKLFNIYKFRTMYVETPKDTPTHLLQDRKKCITRMGSLLRKTSLDEVPQLVNILVGHMSIVGPRPALWNQDDLISLRDKYDVNDVPVGLTGWTQINGRDGNSVPLKAELDGFYVSNKSIWFDMKCMYLTVVHVVTRQSTVDVDASESENSSNGSNK